MRLENKVAIITGAASGIGKATALRFAEEGAKVGVDDINVESGSQLATEIIDNGGTAIFVPADVSVPGSVEQLITETQLHFGRIDVLVNNALCNAEYLLENNWDPIIDVA